MKITFYCDLYPQMTWKTGGMPMLFASNQPPRSPSEDAKRIAFTVEFPDEWFKDADHTVPVESVEVLNP